MNLRARTVHAVPSWCAIGCTVRADIPSARAAITGVVTEIDGLVVTIRTKSGMHVAVDVEDCRRGSAVPVGPARPGELREASRN